MDVRLLHPQHIADPNYCRFSAGHLLGMGKIKFVLHPSLGHMQTFSCGHIQVYVPVP